MSRRVTPEEQALWDQVNSTVKAFRDQPMDLRMPLVQRPAPRPIMDISWSSTLDLHDLTLAEAHTAVTQHIAYARSIACRKVVIITGKSGQIAKEFPTWIELNTLVSRATILNGGGAWKLWLKRTQ